MESELKIEGIFQPMLVVNAVMHALNMTAIIAVNRVEVIKFF